MKLRPSLEFIAGVHDGAIALLSGVPTRRRSEVVIHLIQLGVMAMNGTLPTQHHDGGPQAGAASQAMGDRSADAQRASTRAGDEHALPDPDGSEIAGGELGPDFHAFTSALAPAALTAERDVRS